MDGVTYTTWDTLHITEEVIKELLVHRLLKKRSIADGPFVPLTDVEFDSLYSICPSEVSRFKNKKILSKNEMLDDL